MPMSSSIILPAARPLFQCVTSAGCFYIPFRPLGWWLSSATGSCTVTPQSPAEQVSSDAGRAGLSDCTHPGGCPFSRPGERGSHPLCNLQRFMLLGGLATHYHISLCLINLPPAPGSPDSQELQPASQRSCEEQVGALLCKRPGSCPQGGRGCTRCSPRRLRVGSPVLGVPRHRAEAAARVAGLFGPTSCWRPGESLSS